MGKVQIAVLEGILLSIKGFLKFTRVSSEGDLEQSYHNLALVRKTYFAGLCEQRRRRVFWCVMGRLIGLSLQKANPTKTQARN